MSVLIKDMEMPADCSKCRFLEGDHMDGLCHAAEKWLDDEDAFTWYVYPEGDVDDSKPVNCPLVSVPPHGDLIERKAVCLTDFEIVMCDGDCKDGMKMLLEKIEFAPTIIQADKGEKA